MRGGDGRNPSHTPHRDANAPAGAHTKKTEHMKSKRTSIYKRGGIEIEKHREKKNYQQYA